MGSIAQEMLAGAVDAFSRADGDAAKAVQRRDDEIDAMEMAVEERVVSLLARHAPVARDLRMLVAALRVNQDIERVADLTGKICKSAKRLTSTPDADSIATITQLHDATSAMWHDALAAFLTQDEGLARSVRERDDTVDRVYRDLVRRLMSAEGTPDALRLAPLVTVSKHLERIADHAVDVASEAIYVVRAELLRHSRRETGSES